MTDLKQKVSELDFPPPEELMRRFVSSQNQLASILGKPEVFSEHVEMFTRLVDDCIDLLHRFTLVESRLPGISYFQVLRELLAISRFVSPEGVALNSLRLGQSIATPSMRGARVKPNEALFAALEQCKKYLDTVLPELNRIVFDALKALRESQPVEKEAFARIAAQSAELERIKGRFEKESAIQRSEFEEYKSTAVEVIKQANDEWQQIKIELHAYWAGQIPQQDAEAQGLPWDLWGLEPLTKCVDASVPCAGDQFNNEGGLNGEWFQAFDPLRPKYAEVFVANATGGGTVRLELTHSVPEPSALVLLAVGALAFTLRCQAGAASRRL